MAEKTATDQEFGGRKCTLTSMALARMPNYETDPDTGRLTEKVIGHSIHPVVCIAFLDHQDIPIFRSLRRIDDVLCVGRRFVATEAELTAPGTWTWKDHV